MRSNRRRDTAPEMAVRSLLHRAGERFRVDYAIRGGGRLTHSDIAFPARRVAIFIDGCFWHVCPVHGTMPVRNRDYWEPKLRANVERDAATTVALELGGWTVLRFWEHEPPDTVAIAIRSALHSSSSSARGDHAP